MRLYRDLDSDTALRVKRPVFLSNCFRPPPFMRAILRPSEVRSMTNNLIKDGWADLDSAELRILLNKQVGGPGQYQDRPNNPNKLYLPLGGSSCQIVLTYKEKKIVAIEPGPAFDASEWDRVSEEIEKSILTGTLKVGRDYSFSSFRVPGSWLGKHSGVQILPPPDEAPRAPVEMARHPFILEFPVKVSNLWPITNHRRMQEHRKVTLLLNVLLAGRTSLQLRRPKHFWAMVPGDGDSYEIKWVQQSFFANLGKAVVDELSPPAAKQLVEVDPEEYYPRTGLDGKPLRVPSNLDESISCYMALPAEKRAKFDRAAFWIDMAWRQWNTSMSASFAALVSAIESLTERGDIHQFDCPACGKPTQHEVPGATQRFKDFFETYAPGASLAKQRGDMYGLRSGILHGSELMQLDQDLDFGWDPPWSKEYELYDELSLLTQVALRNWLKEVTMPSPLLKEEKPESRLIFILIMCLIYGGLAALIIGLILLLDWLTL